MTPKHAAVAVLVLASLCLSAAAAATVHTVFTTECTNAHNKYFTWQTLGESGRAPVSCCYCHQHCGWVA